MWQILQIHSLGGGPLTWTAPGASYLYVISGGPKFLRGMSYSPIRSLHTASHITAQLVWFKRPQLNLRYRRNTSPQVRQCRNTPHTGRRPTSSRDSESKKTRRGIRALPPSQISGPGRRRTRLSTSTPHTRSSRHSFRIAMVKEFALHKPCHNFDHHGP